MKTCILCDRKVPPYYVVCRSHYSAFYQYKHEEWFIELQKQQQIQDTIDLTELLGNVEMKDIGRPVSTWRTINTVLELYDESLRDVELGLRARPESLRELARKVNYAVGYVTVRSILQKYRSKNITSK